MSIVGKIKAIKFKYFTWFNEGESKPIAIPSKNKIIAPAENQNTNGLKKG
jgi:hypothetical protein